jgi:hypothetical protein
MRPRPVVPAPKPQRAARFAFACAAVVLHLAFVATAARSMPGLGGHRAAPADSARAGVPGMAPLPPPPALPVDLSKARKVRELSLVVRHRVFHDFAEQVVARVGESFPIGDTEYTATVDRYVPDFAMDIRSGRVLSRSAEARNPAVRVVVREKGVVQDTTWALLDMPPHFGRRSMLAFQVLSIDFTSGRPVRSKQALAPAAKRP